MSAGRRGMLGWGAAIASGSLLSGCSIGTVLATLTDDGGARRIADLAYGDDPRQRLDIYQPLTGSQWPVVMFFYGGSWNNGSRETYRFVGAALAAQGILTVVPDYRVYPQVRYPAFLADCAAATGWTMRHLSRFGGRPARPILVGHSAGAYNAAMLALDPRWLDSPDARGPAGRLRPAAWVGLAGPYDFFPIGNPDVKPVFFHPDYPAGSQPIDYAMSGSPPCFLAAPRLDDVVDPERNTGQLALKLRRAGVPVEERRYDAVGHMTLIGAFAGPLTWKAPVREEVVAFIRAQSAA